MVTINRKLDNVLVGIATIGLLLFIKHFIQTEIVTYSVIMLVAGIAILIFGERILDGEPSRIKSFFVNVIGITLIMGGANFLMEKYNQYWLIFGIAGILLFEFHNSISERL